MNKKTTKKKEDKFFGEVTPNELTKEDSELLAEVLAEDNEELVVKGVAVDESIDLPFKAVSYFRDAKTNKFQLVTIDYDPFNNQVGDLVLDKTTQATDRASIEELFKITASRKIFGR
jgi:hypothetical protein